MGEAYKRLYQGVLDATPTTLYTVPALTQAVVKHIVIVNTITTGDRQAKLWSGGTAVANVILPWANVLASGWVEWEGTITMAAGDTLAGAASGVGALTVSIYGVEVS